MGKIPTYKTDRLGVEPKQTYDNNAESMAAYHKKIILRLVRAYKGDVLREKLSELQFCSLETALEVLSENQA